jgi:predicted RNA-binding protein with PIN domain
MDVIVDGYNVIGARGGLHGSLEIKRRWLLQQLSRYQQAKRFRLTVVFDGSSSGGGAETAHQDGVAVIFSGSSEKADPAIVRLARQKAAGCVVVSSDREVRKAVERLNGIAISAWEFINILRALDDARMRMDLEEDEDSAAHPGRKEPKSERRRKETLRKLRL